MTILEHRFVDEIPGELAPTTLYVSIAYATAVHLCACGCGREVVTPLSPADWSFTFDGETISVSPSIGNWGFECRSHYWVRRDRVVWAAAERPEAAAPSRRWPAWLWHLVRRFTRIVSGD